MGAYSKSRMYAMTVKQSARTIRRVLESFHKERHGYDCWIQYISAGDIEMDDREWVMIGGSDAKGVFHTCAVNFTCKEGEDPHRVVVEAVYCECLLPGQTVKAVFAALESEAHRESRRVERRELWDEEE